MTSTITAKFASTNNTGSSLFKDYITETTKGRKRRLDHLTWEEKLHRKKLKNRVAAQTSRDRKKQKMDEMEITIKELIESNQSLVAECKSLRSQNKVLSHENSELHKQIVSSSSSSSSSKCSSCCQNQNRLVNCNLSNGPAVPITNPLPQGQRIQLATVQKRRRQTILVVLKILMACLMYQTSSPISTPNSILKNLKSLLKAYSKTLPQTWKQIQQKESLQQILSNKITQEKWWGRHQNTWNPVEMIA